MFLTYDVFLYADTAYLNLVSSEHTYFLYCDVNFLVHPSINDKYVNLLQGSLLKPDFTITVDPRFNSIW